jgi:hypothetical protein
MKISTALLTQLALTLVSGTAFSQQAPPIDEEPCPIVEPDTEVPGDPIVDDPIDDDPIDQAPTDPITDGPEDEQPDPERPGDEQPDADEDEGPATGETPGEGPEQTAEDWLLDFPETDTSWQSDGTTFTSDTCTWSEIIPILPDVSLIAGPIECSEGILPTFGLGLISDGAMSAVAIRFLLFFPILTAFEGEQFMDGPSDEELQPPQVPTEEEEAADLPDEVTDEMLLEEDLDAPNDRTFGLRSSS